MGRFSEVLRSLNNLKLLAAVGRSGGELGTIADLVDNFLGSPQMEDCIRRFRALPGGAELMDGRYPPLEPPIAQLQTLPAGTLGREYARLILQLGYDPEFFRPRPIESDGQWLTQRIATTHDIHHVISGFGTERAGETGVLAITAAQIGFPAYVLLTSASQLANFRLKLEEFEGISRAAAHGSGMARQAQCLAIARWEEGWEKPIQQWRQELGLVDPADHEPYGLAQQLADA
ncbi:MAG: Coq4 family protein [Synechococcus sp. WH 8007]|nr:Coq4 family protein [Synechococcus sp. WH 8007]